MNDLDSGDESALQAPGEHPVPGPEVVLSRARPPQEGGAPAPAQGVDPAAGTAHPILGPGGLVCS